MTTGAARRVLVVGALGRMGERIRAAVTDHPGLCLGAALEVPGHPGLGETVAPGVVVSDDLKACLEASEVAIDFSVPGATLALLRAAAGSGVPCVTGTTGFTTEQREEIAQLAARVPIVAAPNFSVAVNVMIHLTREATRLLGPDFDAEIVELHHGAKRDAPSGTALGLGQAVAAARSVPLEERLVLERAGETGPRPPGAIGIQTLRGGDNPGEHTVLWIGRGERVELIHRAATRDHFARGAVQASAWVLDRAAGLYGMEDVLGLSGKTKAPPA